jgi:hypothetical protein
MSRHAEQRQGNDRSAGRTGLDHECRLNDPLKTMAKQVFTAVVWLPGGGRREVSRLADCYYEAKQQFQLEFGSGSIVVGPWPLPVSDHIPPLLARNYRGDKSE